MQALLEVKISREEDVEMTSFLEFMSSRLILFKESDNGLGGIKPRHAGILMEAIAEIASAKEDPTGTVEAWKLALGTDCPEGEDGMIVGGAV